MQHMLTSPHSLSMKTPEVSSAIEKVVMKTLEKDPYNRFASVQEFARAFEQAYLLNQSSFVVAQRREASPSSQKTKEQWLEEIAAHHKAKRFEEALMACEGAAQLDPNRCSRLQE